MSFVDPTTLLEVIRTGAWASRLPVTTERVAAFCEVSVGAVLPGLAELSQAVLIRWSEGRGWEPVQRAQRDWTPPPGPAAGW